jgi:uncharacterized membrane protein
MKKSIFIVSALLTFLLTACGTGATPIPPTAPASAPTDASLPASTSTDAPAAATTVSFANDVSPILQSRCFDCHGGRDTKAGLSIKSYQALMAGSKNGPVVIAGDPANSLLIQLIQQGEMPKRGSKLTPDQLQILIDWITAGALNN